MKKKRTPALAAKMKARRRQGATFAEIARENRVGVATVHAALKTAPPKTPPRTKAPPHVHAPAGEPLAPPTRDELAAFLASQARSLQADIRAAKDAPTRAAGNRNLLACQTLLSRVLPPEPLDEQIGTFVSSAEMTAVAAKCQAKFNEMIDRIAEDAEKLPKCPTCSRPIFPEDA